MTYTAQDYAWMVKQGYMKLSDVPSAMQADVKYIMNYKEPKHNTNTAKTYTVEQVTNALASLLTKEISKTGDLKASIKAVLQEAGIR